MSRIDDLIAEYCPNGVERKPLGAIAKLYRGNGLQREPRKLYAITFPKESERSTQ